MATKPQTTPALSRVEGPVYLVYIFYSLLSSLYICRESSTNSPLFMQNKPNLLDAQMNVSSALTKYYENIANWKLGENKPNSNPIQSQSKPIKPNSLGAQMNVSSALTKDYENEPLYRCGENKPKQTQSPRLRFYPQNQHPHEKKPQKTPIFTKNPDNFSSQFY